jgi:hypothetical protein
MFVVQDNVYEYGQEDCKTGVEPKQNDHCAIQPHPSFAKPIFDDVDQNGAEGDCDSRDEKRFGRMCERCPKCVWVEIESCQYRCPYEQI